MSQVLAIVAKRYLKALKALSNIVAQPLIEASLFSPRIAKKTFFRHVHFLEALIGNVRGVAMVSDRWQLI